MERKLATENSISIAGSSFTGKTGLYLPNITSKSDAFLYFPDNPLVGNRQRSDSHCLEPMPARRTRRNGRRDPVPPFDCYPEEARADTACEEPAALGRRRNRCNAFRCVRSQLAAESDLLRRPERGESHPGIGFADNAKGDQGANEPLGVLDPGETGSLPRKTDAALEATRSWNNVVARTGLEPDAGRP